MLDARKERDPGAILGEFSFRQRYLTLVMTDTGPGDRKEVFDEFEF